MLSYKTTLKTSECTLKSGNDCVKDADLKKFYSASFRKTKEEPAVDDSAVEKLLKV